MELLLRMLEISEKIKKAKTMARSYLSDNSEYQEVAGPLDGAFELLWNFLDDCEVIGIGTTEEPDVE